MKPITERNPVAVGLAGLAVMGLIALAVFFNSDLPLIGGGTTYSAYFTEAAGLQPGNPVRIAGVTVGRVTGVSLAGDRVLVSFKVKNAWVGDASTAGTPVIAWSTRLVVIWTTWPRPCFSICAMASCAM